MADDRAAEFSLPLGRMTNNETVHTMRCSQRISLATIDAAAEGALSKTPSALHPYTRRPSGTWHADD